MAAAIAGVRRTTTARMAAIAGMRVATTTGMAAAIAGVRVTTCADAAVGRSGMVLGCCADAAVGRSGMVLGCCADAAVGRSGMVLGCCADAAVGRSGMVLGCCADAAARRRAMMRRRDLVVHRSLRHSAIGCRDCVHFRRPMRSAKWLLHCCYAWPAVVHGGEKVAIARSHSLMSTLGRSCGNGVPARGELRRRRSCPDSAAAAIEAHTRATGDAPSDDGSINKGISDHRSVDVDNGGVVVKDAAGPEAADEACAEVTEAVVNSTVEANGWTPETCVPSKATVDGAPVTGRPVEADHGWCRPETRNPIVAVRSPGPVARRPLPPWKGRRGLRVYGQRRRGIRGEADTPPRTAKADADTKTNLR
jgi:hypothetical protein